MDHRQNYLSLKDYIKQHFLNIVNDLPLVIDRYQDKKIEVACISLGFKNERVI